MSSDKEMTTITVSDQTCGEIHEALGARIHYLVNLLQSSPEYPESTFKMLREALADVQEAYDEFEAAWGEAEDLKRE